MTSTIITDPVKDEGGFPKLMRYDDGGILLVNGYSDAEKSYIGMVVLDGPGCEIGYYMKSWDRDGLTDFHGTIQLRNDD